MPENFIRQHFDQMHARRLQEQPREGPTRSVADWASSQLAKKRDRAAELASAQIARYRSSVSGDAVGAAQMSGRADQVLGLTDASEESFLDAENELTQAFMREETRLRLTQGNPGVNRWVSNSAVNAGLWDKYGEELGLLAPLVSVGRGLDAGTLGAARAWRSESALDDLRRAEQAQTDADRNFLEILGDVNERIDEKAEINEDSEGAFRFVEQSFKQWRHTIQKYGVAPFRATDRYVRSRFAPTDEVIDVFENEVKLRIETEMGGIERREEMYPRARAATQYSRDYQSVMAGAETWQEKWQAFMDLSSQNPTGFVSMAADTTLESLAATGTGALATFVTKRPLIGMVTQTQMNVGRMRGSGGAELAAAMGYDLSDPEDIQRMIDDPEMRHVWQDRKEAYTMTVAVVDALSLGVAGRQMSQNIGAELALQGLTQAAMGSGGEALGRIASGQEQDPLELVLEGLGELALTPVEVFGVAGQSLQASRRRAIATRNARTFFEGLAATADQSEMQKTLPAKYREVLQEATKDGPVENVSVDARDLREMFQSGVLTPEDLAEAVPTLTTEQILSDIELGTDIVIPTADYAANIVGKNWEGQMRRALRIGDMMTANEQAEVSSQELQDEVAQKISDLEKGITTLEQEQEDMVRTISAEIMETGAARPAVAEQQATHMVAFASVAARRTGYSLKEWSEKYLLPAVVGDISSAQDGDPGPYSVAVDDLPALRGASSPEGQVIDMAARAANLPDDATGEQLAEALDAFSRPPEDDVTFSQSTPLRTGEEDLTAFGLPASGGSVRDIGAALAARTVARGEATGRRADRSQEAAEAISDMMVEEAIFEINEVPEDQSAMGWYTEKFQSALDTLGRAIFPEFVSERAIKQSNLPGLQILKTPQNARDFFTVLVALTSDGARVFDNFAHAKRLYAEFRETGVVPSTTGGGTRNVSMNINLREVARLLAEYGPKDMHTEMLKTATVGEIRKDLKAQGVKDPLPGVGAKETMPYSVAYLGPKLGAFYANLMGQTEYLTMDRWWTRLFNRMRGDTLPRVIGTEGSGTEFNSKGEPQGLKRFKTLIGHPDMSDDQAFGLVIDYAKSYADKGFKHGDDTPEAVAIIEKTANTIYKAAYTELQDQPDNTSDRTFMIRVTRRAVEKLRQQGVDITVADLQAVLWYYEKRLYKVLGARPSMDTGYDSAAMRLAAQDMGADVGALTQRPTRIQTRVPRSEEPVTEEDMRGEIGPDFFGRPGWAILSAETKIDEESTVPVGTQVARQQVRTDRLREDLERRGIPYREVIGYYGGPPETSFIIIADEKTASRIGRDYSQDSILTRDGLVFGEPKPNVLPTGELLMGEAARDQGLYSRLDDGTMFALELDFENTGSVAVLPEGYTMREDRPGLPITPDGKAELFHYSPEERDQIDPAFAGTGRMTRADTFAGSYWGIGLRDDVRAQGGGYVRESDSLGDVLHRAEVDPDALYDYVGDPEGLVKRSTADTQKALTEAGYSGFYMRPGETTLGQTAVLFEAVDVEVADEAEVIEKYRSRAEERLQDETLYQSEPRRDNVVSGTEMTGDGRKFRDFFGDVTRGKRQQAQNLDQYEAPIKLPRRVEEFGESMAKFSGNFDRHIMTSIPGYREMQMGVAYSISRLLKSGDAVLRIGASEGSTVKAIVEAAEDGVTGVAEDPNPDMKTSFDETPQVDGVRFDLSAFGPLSDAGQELWTEDSGEVIRVFDPGEQRFRVVIEQMVFQFISNDRNAQIAAAKEMMEPGGLFYTAEKVGGPAEYYNANEAKKDDFKANFFSQAELAAKRAEVLQKGGDEVEGMTDLQVSDAELRDILQKQFKHVVQVWDSGNFKGYAASDDPATLDTFLSELPDLESDFSTRATPQTVAGEVGPGPGIELFQSAQDIAEGRRTTETPEFRAWFRDSKVVDIFGRPLIVLHGTDRGGFEHFHTGGDHEPGAFFSPMSHVAQSYTSGRGEITILTKEKVMENPESFGFEVDEIGEDYGGGWGIVDPDGNVEEYAASEDRDEVLAEVVEQWLEMRTPDERGFYRVYLSLQDPLEIDARDSSWHQVPVYPAYAVIDEDGEVNDVFGTNLMLMEGYDDPEDLARDVYGSGMRVEVIRSPDDLPPEKQWLFPAESTMSTNAIAEMARDMGHDGVIIRDVFDGGPYGKGGELGDVYIAFEPTQIKSVHNNGTWSSEDARIMYQQRRASIILPREDGRRPVIRLTGTGPNRSDASSVFHESAHWFLYVTERMIKNGDATEQMIDDFERLRGWWMNNAEDVAKDAEDDRVTADLVKTYLRDGTTGDPEIDRGVFRGIHEQFARAHEAYLMEGKSPNNALRRMFDLVSAWLLEIYKSVRGLPNNLDPEIREVFDRMLATDEEIEKARSDPAYTESIAATAEELGVDEETWARLVAMSEDAREEARRELLAEVMDPVRRKTERQWQKRREEIADEEAERIGRKPVYRVFEWLANGQWIGDDQPENLPDAAGLRLDRDMLIADYGAHMARSLPRGKHPMYAKGTGVSADDLAGWFGFSSGHQMLEELAAAPPYSRAVEKSTEARVAKELGDPLRDGTVADKAQAALHNDKRGKLLEAELRALESNRTSKEGRAPTLKAIRAAAREQIKTTRARTAMRVNTYRLAAERAGTRAQRALAGGRFDEAYDEKRKQLFQHALYMEAREAEEMVGKLERLAKQLQRKTSRENVSPGYLAAIDEILTRYDFRKSVTAKAEQNRGALADYLQKLEEQGRSHQIAIPASVLKEVQRRPYRTMTVQELEDVYTSLRNLRHLGRAEQKLIDAEEQRQLDEVVDQLLEVGEQNTRSDGRPKRTGETKMDRLIASGKQILDLVLNAETLLRSLDGWKRGAWYEAIKAPVDAAALRALEMRQKAADDFEELYSVYTRQERQQMSVTKNRPALATAKSPNPQMSHWDMISFALNMGNATNLARLMDKDTGYGFTQAQVDHIKSELTQRDWDFVQSAWDYINSYWAMIRERELRQTGVAPEKVEALPVETPYGTYDGGYYPISYDPRLASMTAADELADALRNMQAGRYGKAATKDGHLQERAAGSGGRVLEVGMHVMHKHVAQVIQDLAYSEVMNNSWRILNDGRVKDFFNRTGREQDREAMEMWLQDVATGPVVGGGVVGRTALRVKNTFTLSKLAFNLSTVLIQMTGVAQSMVQIGKANFLWGLHQYVTHPERTLREIEQVSPFMAERKTTFHRDIYDMMSETRMTPNESRWHSFQEGTGKVGFWLMTTVQYYGVDVPTWMGGYRQGLQQGMSEEQARKNADRAVARAQASGMQPDRSAVERGTVSRDTRMNGVIRLFTTLGSYMFAKGNVAHERFAKARREITGVNAKSAAEVVSLTGDMMLLFTVEALLYHLIKGTLPGLGDDDDDESLAGFLARETAYSIMSTMPVSRDAASGFKGFDAGGAYSSILGELTTPFVQIGQGEIDAALVKSLTSAIGTLTGIPSGQINRITDAWWRSTFDNEEVAPIEYIMGRRD